MAWAAHSGERRADWPHRRTGARLFASHPRPSAASPSVMSGAVEPAAAFFGFMGGSIGLILCALGSAYGTAKAGVGLASVGVMRPQIVMKCIVPIIMHVTRLGAPR